MPPVKQALLCTIAGLAGGWLLHVSGLTVWWFVFLIAFFIVGNLVTGLYYLYLFLFR